MFKEKLYLWKKNKIRTAITMNIRQAEDKPKSRRNLEEVKTKRSQQSRGNWRKTYCTLQKAIRMQMKEWIVLD
jgi:hypothetical protein